MYISYNNLVNYNTIVNSMTIRNNFIPRRCSNKILHLLLFLLLLCWSFGVNFVDSFGMEINSGTNIDSNSTNHDNDTFNLNSDGVTDHKKSSSSSLFENIKYFSPVIVPCFITGIGGYDNTWKKLSGKFYLCRSNFWLAYGLNYNIVSDLKIPFINYNIDLDLHLLGVNVIAFIEACLLFNIICNKDKKSKNCGFAFWTAVNTLQFLDLEIKVCKYYSISLNIFPYVFEKYL